jgi:hypothetical protein
VPGELHAWRLHDGCLPPRPDDGFAKAIGELKESGASMLVVNQIICNGALVGITAGDPLEALHEGLPIVTKCFAATITGG